MLFFEILVEIDKTILIGYHCDMVYLLKQFLASVQNFDFNAGKLKHIPNSVIALSMFMSANAIAQFFGDLVLEFLMSSGVLLYHPLRIDFLFLTAISALLAFHTLQGLRRKEIDVTQDSTQVSWLVEVALLIGDVYYLLTFPGVTMTTVVMRAPFMIFTAINICIVSYIIFRLKLFRAHRIAQQLEEFWEWLSATLGHRG